MSDDLERRLRETGHRLPAPSDGDTAAARAAVVAAAPRPRTRRRPVAAALVLAAAVGGAFGVGYAIAGGKTTTHVKTRVVKQALDAGPGFLPAEGWDTVSSLAATSALAANVPLDAHDRELVGLPNATMSKLGAGGVLFYARFGGATLSASPPQQLLPLQLDDAKRVGGSMRRLHVRVAAWEVDVLIVFGAARPSQATLAAAREELGRLVVPACPDAQQLTKADVAAAKGYVLGWLPSHYRGDPSEVAGATATAAAGADAPRHGQAAHDCGAQVAARTVEVDVVLPKLAKVSASLSQLTYFAARTPEGWTVWARAR
jgi:hypothetical protein